jgi:hypothetical protein
MTGVCGKVINTFYCKIEVNNHDYDIKYFLLVIYNANDVIKTIYLRVM